MMHIFPTIVLLATLFITSGRAKKTDYCSKDLACNGKKNTVCRFGCKPGKGTTALDLDFDFRNQSLYWHNFYRSELAEGKATDGGNGEASNVRALSYDMSLEYTAACWIYYKGVMQHDECRITPKFKTAGQNLWTGNTVDVRATPNIQHVILDWYMEYKDTNKELIDSFARLPDKKIGHFTQVVWASCTHVGCARCSIQGNPKMGLVACNYGPAGNWRGEPVYKRGKGASACDAGTAPNSQFPLLCGEIEPWSDAAKEKGNPELSAAAINLQSTVISFCSIIVLMLIN